MGKHQYLVLFHDFAFSHLASFLQHSICFGCMDGRGAGSLHKPRAPWGLAFIGVYRRISAYIGVLSLFAEKEEWPIYLGSWVGSMEFWATVWQSTAQQHLEFVFLALGGIYFCSRLLQSRAQEDGWITDWIATYPGGARFGRSGRILLYSYSQSLSSWYARYSTIELYLLSSIRSSALSSPAQARYSSTSTHVGVCTLPQLLHIAFSRHCNVHCASLAGLG